MMETMVGSIRRRLFRFLWYRAAALRVLLLCACGSATGKWVGDDSDSVRGFAGETGVGLGRFEEPLDAMRDLLEDFIVCVCEEESKVKCRAAETAGF